MSFGEKSGSVKAVAAKNATMGKAQYISRGGMTVSSSLHTALSIDEVQGVMYYCGKQGGPNHTDLGEPNHTNSKQPARNPKNSNQSSFSNSLIGESPGNSIYVEAEGSIRL